MTTIKFKQDVVFVPGMTLLTCNKNFRNTVAVESGQKVMLKSSVDHRAATVVLCKLCEFGEVLEVMEAVGFNTDEVCQKYHQAHGITEHDELVAFWVVVPLMDKREAVQPDAIVRDGISYRTKTIKLLPAELRPMELKEPEEAES